MRVIFPILPQVEIMDLAGPLQVFHEANRHGARFEMLCCAMENEVPTEQGPWLGRLQSLPEPQEGDFVLVPGGPVATHMKAPNAILDWLRKAAFASARVGSVCTGAFVLGAAGLLDGRSCTTHWSRIEDLRRRFPKAHVLEDRLYVMDGPVFTSAGIASGIDVALALVEAEYGPHIASLAAREMVVYLRRDGNHRPESVYLDYRNHINQGVHRVQDWLSIHPEHAASLPELAEIAAMSVRSLTRQFREATGLSVNAFTKKVRLERAKDLLCDPGLTLEVVAERCGFQDARQLRRIWRAAYGKPPSASRPR
jgi:transcriptional regulator GlxA family with amidase domain